MKKISKKLKSWVDRSSIPDLPNLVEFTDKHFYFRFAFVIVEVISYLCCLCIAFLRDLMYGVHHRDFGMYESKRYLAIVYPSFIHWKLYVTQKGKTEEDIRFDMEKEMFK